MTSVIMKISLKCGYNSTESLLEESKEKPHNNPNVEFWKVALTIANEESITEEFF